MNPDSHQLGPSAGMFRAQAPATTSAGDTTPTERLTGFRQARRQQKVSQSAGGRAARDRRTRRTVDLPLATHRALDVWQREAADRIGVARVTGQEVLAALIDQLLIDRKLSIEITRALQARR
ncbi:ATPase [Mycobacterium paraense]